MALTAMKIMLQPHKDIEKYVHACSRCQEMKQLRNLKSLSGLARAIVVGNMHVDLEGAYIA